jgi:predicted DNA-binding transcriptional regulator AlpA
MPSETLARPPLLPDDIDTLLPSEVIQQLLHVCESTLYRLVRDKRFPPPVCVGRRKLWPAGVVRDFLRKKQEGAA